MDSSASRYAPRSLPYGSCASARPAKRHRLAGDQKCRRLQVLRGARRRRQLGRDRLLHDRVHERQAFAGSEQLDAPQLVGGCLRALASESRERRRVSQRRVRTEHGDRLRESLAFMAEPGQTDEEATAQCPGPEGSHLAGQLDRRASALGPERHGQRLQIERVATGRLAA